MRFMLWAILNKLNIKPPKWWHKGSLKHVYIDPDIECGPDGEQCNHLLLCQNHYDAAFFEED